MENLNKRPEMSFLAITNEGKIEAGSSNRFVREFESKYMNLQGIAAVHLENPDAPVEISLESNKEIAALMKEFMEAKEKLEEAKKEYLNYFARIKGDKKAEEEMKKHWDNILLYITRAEKSITWLRDNLIGN